MTRWINTGNKMGRKWTRMRGRKRHWTTEETKWEVNGSRRFIANWTDASDACAFAQERTFRQTLHPTHLLNESISNRSMTAIYMCNNQFFFVILILFLVSSLELFSNWSTTCGRASEARSLVDASASDDQHSLIVWRTWTNIELN